MATKKQATKPARKAPALRKPDMAPIDAVRNPNFDAAMAEQNYQNNIAQALADYQAQNFTMQNLLPEKRMAAGQGTLAPMGPQAGLATQQGRQNAEDIYNRFNEYASGINELMLEQPQQGSQQMSTIAGPMPKSTIAGPRPQPIQTIAGPRPAAKMNQQKMQAFQNFLNQGMQRNQDMNQAAQNLAGIGGPQKSFSQVAGGAKMLNRMPRKPNPNAIAPSNQKLF